MGASTSASGDREARSPPRIARSSSDLRGAPLRWTRHQPSKVATVSQIAAPQGRRDPAQTCAVPHSDGPTITLRKWRRFRRSQPPKDCE
eukprot:7527955-Pyramimonas_sp.AAC.1